MASTSTRDTQRQGNESLANVVAFKQKGSSTCYGGTGVVINSSGYAEPAAAAASKLTAGIAIKDSVNAGSDGDSSIEVRRGQFPLNNSTTDPVVQGDVLGLCYWEDNDTVCHTASGKSAAGKVQEVRDDGQIVVDVNSIAS